MIEERALIRNSDADSVVFQVIRTGPCNKCAIREYCYRNDGVMSVSRDRIRSAREDVLEPADTAVRLRIRNASVLGLSAVVYGLPLLAFVIGLVLGYFVLFPGLGPTYQPLGAFGVAVGFLALAGAVISRFDRQVQDRVSYEVEPMGSRAGSPTGGEGSTDLHSRMDPGQGASATDEMLTR